MIQTTAAHGDEPPARPLDITTPTASKITRLPAFVCWGGLLLSLLSLALPAIRMEGNGAWLAGDLGYVCLFLSLAVFPCWVPHALIIAAPFINRFAGKTAAKATGVVLALMTLSVLQTCVPNVLATDFRQGFLAGFWLWALALVTTSAGLLIAGFSSGRSTRVLHNSARLPAAPDRLSRLAIVLCWVALALFIMMNLRGLSFYFRASAPQPVGRGGFGQVQDPLIVPALLAMAPVACAYASARTQRLLALMLGAAGLFPFVSIAHPAEQPVELLAPYLLSYLNIAVSLTGLLISAGLHRRPTASRASARAESPESQNIAPEPTISRSNPALGAALCWVSLAHFLALDSRALAALQANEPPGRQTLAFFFTSEVGYALLAMSPLVCNFGTPLTRRLLAALLVVQLVAGPPHIMWFGLHALTPGLVACALSAAGLLAMDVLEGRKP